MNALSPTHREEFPSTARSDLLGAGLAPLKGVAQARDRLNAALDGLKQVGDSGTAKRAERLMRQLESFEPSVTFIGQIKSGKTSLVNALVGQPNLLPADVNPWTSVVTSLHLHPDTDDVKEAATFRFFDEDEWDRLVTGGGRIGELASRAGADEELEKIKAQAAEMREKSRQRLGRKFELLLGQQRDYGYVDKDLIERYVCLGEEPDADDIDIPDEQGRFADITKSADLALRCPDLPIRLCLRDTPGVNDTFMMREQITIRAIRDSRLCVVVLSAHQALSSTDLALIRLITHVKSRDVIIFVNRIDELSNPSVEIPQIKASIAETLARHKGPEDAEVIFGSALWAGHALSGRLDALPQTSAQALARWSDEADPGNPSQGNDDDDPVTLAWGLSGIPQLQRAMAVRIAETAARAALHRIGTSAFSLSSAVAARERMSARSYAAEGSLDRLDSAAAHARFSALAKSETDRLITTFDSILAEFSDRMGRVQANFLERATASLMVHLEKHGDGTPWTYDPAGLRMLLGSSHKVLARKAKSAFEASVQTARQDLSKLYAQAFGLTAEQITIARPPAPDIPAPVTLGRTIALDLNGSWWKRWWLHRRGYKAYASSFHDLIKTETDPFIEELRDDIAVELRNAAVDAFELFLSEQRAVFGSLDEMAQANPEQLKEHLAATATPDREALLRMTMERLSEYAA